MGRGLQAIAQAASHGPRKMLWAVGKGALRVACCVGRGAGAGVVGGVCSLAAKDCVPYQY